MTVPAKPSIPLLEVTIVRVFDAPAAMVFRQWIEAESLADWFAADTYTTLECDVDASPGGRWRMRFRGHGGHTYEEHGSFLEIDAPRRLVLTLVQEDSGHVGPETTVTVDFAEEGGRTRMTFHQTGFDTPARRDGNAEGWRGCFDKLARRLTAI